MSFRQSLANGLAAIVALSAGCEIDIDGGEQAAPPAASFDVVEATIPEMQRAMAEGRVTSRALVQQYLTRVAYYENLLNPTITINRDALAEAERLDAERAAGRVRGPLHGIPIALKDNIHTVDMPTTGGALAFEGLIPPYEATITENLRAAGAVIIAKTVMTELANWVAGDPFFMPGNYSSLGGYGFNPYDPRRDPRPGLDDGRPVLSTGGSSSGIGVPRAGFVNRTAVPGADNPRGGLAPAQIDLMNEAVEVLRREGAIVVDPADIPSAIDTDPERNYFRWNICASEAATRGNDTNCSIVFKYGMKRDFNSWLASLGASAPVASLAELRAWNRDHAALGTLRYGQARLDISDEVDVEADRERYEADRAKDIELAGTHGIDAALAEHGLDALLFPLNRGANIAARPGYPSVIVPFGMTPNEPDPPFPDGFDALPAPFAVSFTGPACSEPRLIGLAYDFEQATLRREPPPSSP